MQIFFNKIVDIISANINISIEQKQEILEIENIPAEDWSTPKVFEELTAISPRDRIILEPKDGLMAIGSGGNYALAAARAMFDSKLKPEEIAKKSLEIAAELCIYTNNNIILEKIK